MGWYSYSGRYVETYRVTLTFDLGDGGSTSITQEVVCASRDEALVEAAFKAVHFSEYVITNIEVRLKYGS